MSQFCNRCGTSTTAEVVFKHNNENFCTSCGNAYVQLVINRVELKIGRLATAKLGLASSRGNAGGRSGL
uniref:TFIIB-type domain-containing protein n=1 Tax=Mesocestoides corti TaxID=53468 RepID=A0A5K3ELC3_MESCO